MSIAPNLHEDANYSSFQATYFRVDKTASDCASEVLGCTKLKLTTRGGAAYSERKESKASDPSKRDDKYSFSSNVSRSFRRIHP